MLFSYTKLIRQVVLSAIRSPKKQSDNGAFYTVNAFVLDMEGEGLTFEKQ